MQCPTCRHANPEGQKFCGECGARLTAVAPSAAATPTPSAPSTPPGPPAVSDRFGAPIAHEDHAHRALCAALAIERELEPLAADVRRSHAIEFRLRMGINTGLVVVGAIGKDLRMDYTAVGDTTNLAARLLGLAKP